VPAVAPVVSAKPRRAWWAVAAAAAILVVSTFAALRLLPAGATRPAEQEAQAAQPTPLAAPPWREDDRNVVVPERVEEKAGGSQDRKFVAGGQSPRPRRDVRRGLVHDASFDGGRVKPEAAAAATDEEITTDFMPLSYGGGFSQIDDGQMVRVELPRSALHSFGLPVNAERAGERVKADVLLGHDGVARAIRFVR
jgi:hypothetical protein